MDVPPDGDAGPVANSSFNSGFPMEGAGGGVAVGRGRDTYAPMKQGLAADSPLPRRDHVDVISTTVAVRMSGPTSNTHARTCR